MMSIINDEFLATTFLQYTKGTSQFHIDIKNLITVILRLAPSSSQLTYSSIFPEIAKFFSLCCINTGNTIDYTAQTQLAMKACPMMLKASASSFPSMHKLVTLIYKCYHKYFY